MPIRWELPHPSGGGPAFPPPAEVDAWGPSPAAAFHLRPLSRGRGLYIVIKAGAVAAGAVAAAVAAIVVVAVVACVAEAAIAASFVAGDYAIGAFLLLPCLLPHPSIRW